VYYKATDESIPAIEFLDACPGKIDAEFAAVLDAVAAAPPPQFSGGEKWEAMHGAMTAGTRSVSQAPAASSSGSSDYSRTQTTRSS
jgi:hypothetical protein